MKLMRGNRNRWSMAFSVMFAVQLLASSLCIATAVQAVEITTSNHCHESTMPNMSRSDIQSASMQHEANAMDHSMASACTHCASPNKFTVFAAHVDHSPVTFLLAYVATESPVSTSEVSSVSFTERAQSPPRSSTTLFTTTQRIRI